MACASSSALPEEPRPLVTIPVTSTTVTSSPAAQEGAEDKPRKRYMLEWGTDERAARERARRERLPLIVLLTADWSGGSLQMQREVFSDPRIVFRESPLVALRIDLTNTDAPEAELLAAKYAARGVPTTIFFDAEGHEVARLDGAHGADEVLAAIRAASIER